MREYGFCVPSTSACSGGHVTALKHQRLQRVSQHILVHVLTLIAICTYTAGSDSTLPDLGSQSGRWGPSHPRPGHRPGHHPPKNGPAPHVCPRSTIETAWAPDPSLPHTQLPGRGGGLSEISAPRVKPPQASVSARGPPPCLQPSCPLRGGRGVTRGCCPPDISKAKPFQYLTSYLTQALLKKKKKKKISEFSKHILSTVPCTWSNQLSVMKCLLNRGLG